MKSLAQLVPAIGTALSTAKAAADLTVALSKALPKDRATLIAEIEKIKEQVTASSTAMVEFSGQVNQLVQERNELAEKLDAAEKRLSEMHEVKMHDNAVWKKTETGEEGPFCCKCYYGSEKQLVPLVDSHGMNGQVLGQQCPVCRQSGGKHVVTSTFAPFVAG